MNATEISRLIYEKVFLRGRVSYVAEYRTESLYKSYCRKEKELSNGTRETGFCIQLKMEIHASLPQRGYEFPLFMQY